MNEDGINHKNKNSPQKSSRIRQRQQRQTKKFISSRDDTIIRDKTKNQKRTRKRRVERFCYLSFLLTFIICMTSLLVFFVATIEQHEHDSTHNNIPLTSSSSSSLSMLSASLSSASVISSRLESKSMPKNTTNLLIKDDTTQTNESRTRRRRSTHNNNNNNNNAVLYPHWIIQYVEWHQAQRRKFPGEELFTNPKAPKLLVRTCLGLCGGLHDRLGQLPWDLYLATKLQRVLLLAWQRPRSLEHFLVPPLPIIQNKTQDTNNTNHHHPDSNHRLYLDWTIPPSQQFGFQNIKRVRSDVVELFAGYNEAKPGERYPGEEQFWKDGFEHSLVRAGAESTYAASKSTYVREANYADAKLLRHRLLGHLDEDLLELLLDIDGYYDNDKVHTPQHLHETPTFGNIWKLFFRPSVDVRNKIISSLQDMNLLSSSSSRPDDKNNNENSVDPISLLPRPVASLSSAASSTTNNPVYYIQNYTAVHCRVRHPKSHPIGKTMMGKDGKYPADKTGLPWVDPGGAERQFAIETAYQALHCATEIATTIYPNNENSNRQPQKQPLSQPIYFLSDSNDLVKHVSIELYDEQQPHGYLYTHHNNTIQSIYPPLFQLLHRNNHNHNTSTSHSTTQKQKQQQKKQKNQQYVRARDVTLENAHIDIQKGRQPPAYYGTFIDLYLTMNANCVVYGIGYYAAFAAKISGVPCTFIYAHETWGRNPEKTAQLCPALRPSSVEETVPVVPVVVPSAPTPSPAPPPRAATTCTAEQRALVLQQLPNSVSCSGKHHSDCSFRVATGGCQNPLLARTFFANTHDFKPVSSSSSLPIPFTAVIVGWGNNNIPLDLVRMGDPNYDQEWEALSIRKDKDRNETSDNSDSRPLEFLEYYAERRVLLNTLTTKKILIACRTPLIAAATATEEEGDYNDPPPTRRLPPQVVVLDWDNPTISLLHELNTKYHDNQLIIADNLNMTDGGEYVGTKDSFTTLIHSKLKVVSPQQQQEQEPPPSSIIHYLDLVGRSGGYGYTILMELLPTLLPHVRFLHFEYHDKHQWSSPSYTLQELIAHLQTNGLICYWSGDEHTHYGLWRITDCFLEHYHYKHWSRIQCVSGRHADVQELATRMETQFLTTIQRTNSTFGAV